MLSWLDLWLRDRKLRDSLPRERRIYRAMGLAADAELNNLRIRVEERDSKITRQAGVIAKLEQSRKDMKTDREALLRVARAAKQLTEDGGWKFEPSYDTKHVDIYWGLLSTLKEVEHLLK